MTGGYGGADILHGCTIAVEKGEIAVIVGPNGAGKSTAMKAVFGMLPLREGRVRSTAATSRALAAGAGARRHGLRAADLATSSSAMTVQENLEMGAFIRDDDFSGRWSRSSTCSRSCGEAPPAGGRAFRRPAPAGRGGPRADDQAQGADARRADRRRLAHRDGRAVRQDHRDRAHRHLHPDGRAERPPGAEHRRPGYVLVQGRNRFTDTGEALLADPEVRRSFLGG
jgi:branched-chain amino acid transport system ATP-binding protein